MLSGVAFKWQQGKTSHVDIVHITWSQDSGRCLALPPDKIQMMKQVAMLIRESRFLLRRARLITAKGSLVADKSPAGPSAKATILLTEVLEWPGIAGS